MGYSRDQAILIGVVFMILPTTFTVLRVLARFKRRIGLAVDDYLILCALACSSMSLQKDLCLTYIAGLCSR